VFFQFFIVINNKNIQNNKQQKSSMRNLLMVTIYQCKYYILYHLLLTQQKKNWTLMKGFLFYEMLNIFFSLPCFGARVANAQRMRKGKKEKQENVVFLLSFLEI